MTRHSIPAAWHQSPLVVAIPVKDEAERIGGCLEALARQQGCAGHQVLLLLNNCTDGTEAVVRALAPSLPMPVHVVARTLPPPQANAGHARRVAMEQAAQLLGPTGLLLTTDADGQVAPDWIAATLAAFRQGAEAVAGCIDVDPLEAAFIPAYLHAEEARECTYASLLDEIDSLLDPDPSDPWPRHDQHSGASIAVTLDAYRRAGGIPAVAMGEDRAFFAALRVADIRIRHDPNVQVTVSCRIEGRAVGGMADTIRRRMQELESVVDGRLEPAGLRARRSALRARARTAWAGSPPDAALAADLGVSHAELERAMLLPVFGAAWNELEERSPALVRVPVNRVDLERETENARRIRDRLRLALTEPVGGGPAGIAAAAAATSA